MVVAAGLGALLVGHVVLAVGLLALVALVVPPLADSGRLATSPAPVLLQDALGVGGPRVVFFVVVGYARAKLIDEHFSEQVVHCLWRRLLELDQVFDLFGVVGAVEAPAEVAVGVHGVDAHLHDVEVVLEIVHQLQGVLGRHHSVVKVGLDQ